MLSAYGLNWDIRRSGYTPLFSPQRQSGKRNPFADTWSAQCGYSDIPPNTFRILFCCLSERTTGFPRIEGPGPSLVPELRDQPKAIPVYRVDFETFRKGPPPHTHTHTPTPPRTARQPSLPPQLKTDKVSDVVKMSFANTPGISSPLYPNWSSP